jgi:CheY-like chemotaxis protein
MNTPLVLHARTVLVLDDDVDTLDAMRYLLAAQGAHVVTGANGVDGLAELARRTPDVVLSDLTMPGMGGLEFAQRLRRDPRGQRVLLIAVTGETGPATLTETWLAGFDGYVAKPVTSAVFKALVARIAQHTSHLDPPELHVPALSADTPAGAPRRVLGDLLYADAPTPLVLEADWVGLIESMAAGDPQALQTLFHRVHRLVFALAARITQYRTRAEDVTLEVFHDVWRRASAYDAERGSVVGWILKQTRSRAIARAPFAPRDPRRRLHAEWSTDLGRFSSSLRTRLARRLARTTGGDWKMSAAPPWREPEWQEVAPGITCQLLATDAHRNRLSMLVRLAPGTEYPPHQHEGVEELYMLQGALVVDEDTFYPGDYRRAPASSVDRRVWSETGCTGVLLTSLGDVIL